ncbi:tetratricopeptide repeat-containing sensor histidine kinase [Dyadobacter fermentans]|uniref:histidine kinase n=1 Tax=Dyadobacter fermentans (strain ATCC 700827 / DSM 18053 / CIP 107007 / KCTC 52180 / NS114) TaxID=471854 RepID=C6VZ72_DYAFD|nr:sensor histidine kinase [Dyadobacter fermentans]ACT91684.1 histidine kinase [Dyadobacter fermentans DSM 18053]
MNEFYKLILLFSLGCLLSASQCSTVGQHNGRERTEEVVESKPQEGFAEDTVLIHQYHKLASEYLFQDAEKSMFYSKHVLRLSQKHQWGKGKLLAYNLLSTYYLLDGSYDVLRELSNETITLSRQLNMPMFTAHGKRFLGESYSEYRQWDSSRINYEHAVQIFTRLKADSSLALSIENLGNCYREKSMYDVAVKLYDQAYEMFDKMNSDWGRATVLQSIGYMHVRLAHYAESEKYFQQSIALFRKIGNRYGEVNCLNDLSNTYYYQKKYDQSIEAGLRALAYSKIYHSTQQTNWALVTLSRSYKAKGMYDVALDYSQAVNFVRRMIHDETIKRQYTMYQLMHDNKLMDNEIQQKIINEQRIVQRFLIGFSCLAILFVIFLWFNNKKLRAKNAEIQSALIEGQTIERKRVAAELHDHLGGTLASLNWYLYGIDKKVLSEEEQKIYDSVHQMVGAAYKEVRSLSHNLMPAELEEHGLTMALHRLISKLNENKNIAFTFNLTGMNNRLNNKIEFELYSIVLELTNNIIKHSGATQASVDLTENVKTIVLVVSDNGTGMIEPNRQGVGLRNIKSRVESLHGKIQIQSEAQHGIRIEIEIPKVIIR